MGCEVEKTSNLDDIGAVLFDPVIYDRITTDGCPESKDFVIPDQRVSYYVGKVNGHCASLFIEHGGKIHYMVLDTFKMLARELLEKSITLCGLSPIYCEISAEHQSLINFAKHSGFEQVSISEPVWLKNGVLYPQHKLVRRN